MSLLIQPARQEDFLSCREQVFERNFLQHGIGSLAEKSQHAILKNYYCPNPAEQEINLGPFVADIANREGVTEIQTIYVTGNGSSYILDIQEVTYKKVAA